MQVSISVQRATKENKKHTNKMRKSNTRQTRMDEKHKTENFKQSTFEVDM